MEDLISTGNTESYEGLAQWLLHHATFGALPRVVEWGGRGLNAMPGILGKFILSRRQFGRHWEFQITD